MLISTNKASWLALTVDYTNGLTSLVYGNNFPLLECRYVPHLHAAIIPLNSFLQLTIISNCVIIQPFRDSPVFQVMH